MASVARSVNHRHVNVHYRPANRLGRDLRAGLPVSECPVNQEQSEVGAVPETSPMGQDHSHAKQPSSPGYDHLYPIR